MRRCLTLAALGVGKVAPNPVVGAVLVHEGRIIGEGYHREFGGAHAEVNCLESVREPDRALIPSSTLYVSLEPCAHHGKTPPCTNLIIRNKIPAVVVGVRDPFPAVDGKGIEKLRAHGVQVTCDVLEDECTAINRRFFVFHTRQRPYVILKWAQTADSKISAATNERLLISNATTNRLVHKWRSEEAAILVGTTTARSDDPALNNRLWTGKHPVRMVIDRQCSLPEGLKILDGSIRTIVFNTIRSEVKGNTRWYRLEDQKDLIPQILRACFELNIQSLFVEGGAHLLQSFVDDERWDEARVITNTTLLAPGGLRAPVLSTHLAVRRESFETDTIHYFHNKHVVTA